MRARVVASIAAVALAAAACGTGSEVAAGDGGIGSGVGVHGEWSIDVYDADGTVAQSAAFSNHLVPTGEQLLHDLLSRSETMGAWGVRLNALGTDPVQPCSTAAGDATCSSVEPGWFLDGDDSSIFETLTVTPSGGPDFTLTLAGSVTASNTTEVDSVSATFETCEPTDTAEVCGGDGGTNVAGGRDFTQAVVSTLDWDNDGTANDGPIPVTAGQTVQVTVEISFGTLP